MTRRIAYRRALKPDKVALYCQLHDAFSDELRRLYLEHGIVEVSSFLAGNDLIVMLEVEPSVFDAKQAALESHPLEQQWQRQMAELDADGQTLTYREVFRLTGA